MSNWCNAMWLVTVIECAPEIQHHTQIQQTVAKPSKREPHSAAKRHLHVVLNCNFISAQ